MTDIYEEDILKVLFENPGPPMRASRIVKTVKDIPFHKSADGKIIGQKLAYLKEKGYLKSGTTSPRKWDITEDGVKRYRRIR